MRSATQDWESQWRRVRRWYERIEDNELEEIVLTRVESLNGEHFGQELKKEIMRYEDDLLAFFQNCWHLKDYIKNDRNISSNYPNLESDLEQRHRIKICQDIANRTKHLSLKTSKRDGRFDGRVKSLESSVSMRDGKGTTKPPRYDWLIKATDALGQTQEEYLALTVARQALGEWKTYLNIKG